MTQPPWINYSIKAIFLSNAHLTFPDHEVSLGGEHELFSRDKHNQCLVMVITINVYIQMLHDCLQETHSFAYLKFKIDLISNSSSFCHILHILKYVLIIHIYLIFLQSLFSSACD